MTARIVIRRRAAAQSDSTSAIIPDIITEDRKSPATGVLWSYQSYTPSLLPLNNTRLGFGNANHHTSCPGIRAQLAYNGLIINRI